MRRHLLHLCAAVLLLASAAAQSAVINTDAVTITYNDNESFGSFPNNFESSLSGTTFGSLLFNSVSNVSSNGQGNNSTSLISLTIKAAPGFALSSVGFSETGNWATSRGGSVDVSAQGGILDTATGAPLSPTPILVSKDTLISDGTLAAGDWSMSDGLFIDPTAPGPSEITVLVARTLSANGGDEIFGGGSALIGNTSGGFFGSGTGLNFFYSAHLVPEPATYVISALGFILLMVMRLKRQ
jgi:hypothetical protein